MGVELLSLSSVHSTSRPPLSLDLAFEDGRSILGRRVTEMSGSCHSQSARKSRQRVSSKACGGSKFRRTFSLGSALVGSTVGERAWGECSSLRRTLSRSMDASMCRAIFTEDSGDEARGIEEDGHDLSWKGLEKQAEGTVLVDRNEESQRFGFGRSHGIVDRGNFQWSPPTGFGARGDMEVAAFPLTGDEKLVAKDHARGTVDSREISERVGDRADLSPKQHAEGSNIFQQLPASPRQGVDGSSQNRARAICGLSSQVEGVNLPASLRTLKRRVQGKCSGGLMGGAGESACCCIKKAFSSMVYMIKVVQSHALHMRQALFLESDIKDLLALVQWEMHSSFVWLFQKVFSCTPKLMVSVMILLANFTVYSMGENLAVAAAVSVEPPVSIATYCKNWQSQGVRKVMVKDDAQMPDFTFKNLSKFPSFPDLLGPVPTGCGAGGSNGKTVIVAGGTDGDGRSWGPSPRGALYSEKESSPGSYGPDQVVSPHEGATLFVDGSASWQQSTGDIGPKGHQVMVELGSQSFSNPSIQGEGLPCTVERVSEQFSLQSLLEETARELELKVGEPYHYVQLDQGTISRLVAPVSVTLERDDYACFDRTDLEYQHAPSMEPTSTLLLANYAQFLYVCRHDNNRAEDYFHQAMQADPSDGEVLGRFASFLWLARADQAAAERAYQAAMASDPSNSFHAANYAHFLWHAGDEDASCPNGPPTF